MHHHLIGAGWYAAPLQEWLSLIFGNKGCLITVPLNGLIQ